MRNMEESELLKYLDLGEDQDIEFKLASGGFPNDAWRTISAFANMGGGYLVLGVGETNGKFEIKGIDRPEKLMKVFWDAHNNGQKLNTPLCNQSNIAVKDISGLKVVIIHVPSASRLQRPVFINGNPFTGTYKRNYEGDYRCTDIEVRQMLRDAGDEPQDALIIEHFDLEDLDIETMKAFRNRFASREPDHPFLALDDRGLLEQLGGWRRDRTSGRSGLTLAGILMFGRERSLLDALPHYHLDYQEKLTRDPEERWTYRLTLDGRWEPNLFNFYFRVYPRLVDGLNVPFKLDKDAVRRGETHVHEALREALVNTLIHADHQSSRPMTVIKRPDAFLFLNPGRLRIPVQRLYEGGVSDPRNPNLQKMFQMLGLGEKAGSGFQKILRAWKEQHWLIPLVAEKLDLDMTAVTLPLVSLIPEATEKELRGVVGDAYSHLTELDRIILVMAHRFGEVGNSDIQPYRREHPREIGERLKFLVKHNWLVPSGQGRGTKYQLPTHKPADLFAQEKDQDVGTSQHYIEKSQHYNSSSQHYKDNSEHYEPDSEHYKSLLEISAHVSKKGRTSKEVVRQTILRLCSEHYLSLRTLAGLLKRESASIQNHYLSPMVKEGVLVLRFPERPNHPQQGYKTKEGSVS